MKDHIKEAFGRMSLRQIRSFFLYGTDDFAENVQPYKERLELESNPIYKRLESVYPDGAELDKAVGELSQALIRVCLLELGMKAGARLLYHLLLTDDE